VDKQFDKESEFNERVHLCRCVTAWRYGLQQRSLNIQVMFECRTEVAITMEHVECRQPARLLLLLMTMGLLGHATASDRRRHKQVKAIAGTTFVSRRTLDLTPQKV